ESDSAVTPEEDSLGDTVGPGKASEADTLPDRDATTEELAPPGQSPTSNDVSSDDDWYTATEKAPAGDLAATVQSECLPRADAGASPPSWDAPCMEDSMAGTV